MKIHVPAVWVAVLSMFFVGCVNKRHLQQQNTDLAAELGEVRELLKRSNIARRNAQSAKNETELQLAVERHEAVRDRWESSEPLAIAPNGELWAERKNPDGTFNGAVFFLGTSAAGARVEASGAAAAINSGKVEIQGFRFFRWGSDYITANGENSRVTLKENGHYNVDGPAHYHIEAFELSALR